MEQRRATFTEAMHHQTNSASNGLNNLEQLKADLDRVEKSNARALARINQIAMALHQPGTPLPDPEPEVMATPEPEPEPEVIIEPEPSPEQDVVEQPEPATDTFTAPEPAAPPVFPAHIPAAGLPGLSIVTCAMNRTENLLRALPGWLAHPMVSEVVVVDWSSHDPVTAALAQSGISDRRIRVVRVDGAPRWILSYAFNTGFRAARFNTILKLDADIVLSDDFLLRNILPGPGEFVAGNWRTAAEGQEYVNGFFMVGRDALARVGGFNEFITTYGWDDDDIYARFEASGLHRRDVAPDTIHHLPHSDTARTGLSADDWRPARETVMATPRFMIQRNRKLVERLPTWSGQFSCLPMAITQQDGTGLTLAIAGPPPHPVPDDLLDATSREMLQELMSWDFGGEVMSLPAETFERVMQLPLAQIDKTVFHRALAGDVIPTPRPDATPPLAAPGLTPARARFFIDAQHGLGNRLRAIGSAAAIAAASDRELVIVWQPDDHCDCRFTDLFRYEGAVIEQAFPPEAARARTYNYMTIEGGEKDALIAGDEAGDIYARSAFVLNAPQSGWVAENRFLQQLVPVEAVQALVASVRHPNDVSAHIRMEAGPGLDQNSYDRPENWQPEDHALIHEWRSKSHFSHFMARLDALMAEGRAQTIFLAADLPQTYGEFTDRYGERLAWLPRQLYDRSAEQLHYALADAILLSRAPLMLGSTWSSFSELAMRLAPGGIKVEMSGRDF
jgi:hypothetical protein